MNFCGGEVDQQVADYSSENLLAESSPMCGACVKVESEDQLEETKQQSPNQQGDSHRATSTKPPSSALADISVRVSKDGISANSFSDPDLIGTNSLIGKRISMPTSKLLETPRQTQGNMDPTFPTPATKGSPSSRIPGSSIYGASPSPILLNPLSHSDWIEKPKANLLCPTLDRRENNSPSEQLMVRLEEGFRVKYVGGPGSPLWKGHILRLFLHQDRTRLCLEATKLPEEKEDESPDFILEMHVHKILKLETKGGPSGNRPRRSFCLVIQDGESVEYYDFEAKSTLEREVVVSTVVVLLDQACHSSLPMRPSTFPSDDIEQNSGVIGAEGYFQDSTDYQTLKEGTMDQPILCSPSLQEDDKAGPASSAMGSLSLSPQRRTHIYNDDEGTETSLVIHLENTFSIESQSGSSSATHKEAFQRDLQQEPRRSGDSGSQAGHKSMSSCAHLSGGNWCTDDVCSLALRDMADTCTGIFDTKQGGSSCFPPNGSSSEHHLLLEEYIATAMGAPNAMYSYIMENDGWKAESTTPRGERLDASRRVQNRANILNAQALRLRNLRNEMTFAAALKQSKEKMHYVQTTQSFDDAVHHPTRGHLNEAASKAAEKLHASPLLQHVVDTMMMNEKEVKQSEEGAVVYYDSDPEDVKPRTIHKRAPRRVVAERQRIESVKAEEAGRPSCRVNSMSLDKIPANRKVKKLDEDSVIEIVQTMSNERLILIWHPTQSKNTPNRSPLCVKVWIESGVYLVDGTFLLPKLTWIKASEDSGSGSQRKNKRQQKALRKFDLLDVCRICPTEKVDRRLHPFASASKSFYIETGNEVFLMEAQTSAERDRIVYGLKLVIARLASLLMLRDMRAADEFFGASTVPGEAPRWARGEEQRGSSGEGEPESSSATDGETQSV